MQVELLLLQVVSELMAHLEEQEAVRQTGQRTREAREGLAPWVESVEDLSEEDLLD